MAFLLDERGDVDDGPLRRSHGRPRDKTPADFRQSRTVRHALQTDTRVFERHIEFSASHQAGMFADRRGNKHAASLIDGCLHTIILPPQWLLATVSARETRGR